MQIEDDVQKLTGGYGAHAVICTAGSEAAYKQALKLLRNLGTLVCVGLNDANLPISPFQLVVRGMFLPSDVVPSQYERIKERILMLDIFLQEYRSSALR